MQVMASVFSSQTLACSLLVWLRGSCVAVWKNLQGRMSCSIALTLTWGTRWVYTIFDALKDLWGFLKRLFILLYACQSAWQYKSWRLFPYSQQGHSFNEACWSSLGIGNMHISAKTYHIWCQIKGKTGGSVILLEAFGWYDLAPLVLLKGRTLCAQKYADTRILNIPFQSHWL